MGKQRIAILGGGVAAMSSAFWLTSYPGWKDEWEIDVYQMGWRLGGKGASGRNAGASQRIEEHGLHLFLGFYDNAFRTMRDLYAELARGPGEPLATWDQAWKPVHRVVFMERVGGEIQQWPIDFPPGAGEPGDGTDPLTGWGYVQLMLEWMTRWLQDLGLWSVENDEVVDRLISEVDTTARRHPGASGEIRVREVVRGFMSGVFQRVVEGISFLASLTDLDDQLIHAAIRLASGAGPADDSGTQHSAVGELVQRVRDRAWQMVEPYIESDPRRRRAFIMLDLAAAAINGMIHDDLVGEDPYWFRIDDQSFRSWLRKHGATELTLRCAPLQAAHQLVFAEGTDLAAGTAMSGILRMLLGYKGGIFWEMQAGMGDTVFGPFYEVLRRRGVRFHFFHRLDRLELAPDKKHVQRIHLGRQIEVRDGAEYEPLVMIKDLPCWPSAPLYEQLVGGDELAASGQDLEDWWTRWVDRGAPLTLERGKHFDIAILGTSLPTFPYVATEVMDAHLPFKLMVEQVAHTQTQAMQLWFKPSLAGLGWDGPPPIVGNFELWGDTWADLTHLLEREDWPDDARPGNLAYVVSRLLDDEHGIVPRSDHGYTARQTARVRASFHEWLSRHAGKLWPRAADRHDPGALNWWFLHDPLEREGAARLEAQYFRGTLNPSERYVLSEPGATKYRLRPHETGIKNLLHVGDHTFTGVNAGCVEAAVMSGMAASRTLCSYPRKIPGDISPRKGPWGNR